MKCEIVQDLLPLYVDNICSGETKEAVQEHLQTCELCQKKEMELRAEFILEVEAPEDLDKIVALKKREKAVITAVNEKLLKLGAKVDIVVTAIMLAVMLRYFIMAEGLAVGIRTALLSCPEGVPTGGILFVFIVYDCIYLIHDKREKDTFVTGGIALLSIATKVIGLLIIFVYLICKMTAA